MLREFYALSALSDLAVSQEMNKVDFIHHLITFRGNVIYYNQVILNDLFNLLGAIP